MHSYSPKLIFIDGPTSIGKDYFINNLSFLLEQNYPSKVISTIRATDIVLNSYTETENRKYSYYTTDETKRNSIFMGHINLLCELNKRLFLTKEADVILINRSFLSFLIYNVYSAINSASGNNYTDRFLSAQLNDYIETYSRLFHSLFNNKLTLFINLGSQQTTFDDYIDLILTRIKSREDNKTIDVNWVKVLIETYETPDSRFIENFSFYENIDSKGYEYIFNKYFT